ncbi:MAG: ATP-binding protein [Clostridia bacterium]|nr:ATP-binding protein [Clostridia bacterium]
MRDDNFLLETFNLLYKQGMGYKEQGNYLMAKRDLLKASATMIKIAQNSTGELRDARLERARRIRLIADSLPSENGMPPEIDMPNNNNNYSSNYNYSQQPQQNGGGRPQGQGQKSSNQGDNTETIFKAADIPNISFDDVAGLEDVKESINMRIILPLRYPEIYAAYNKKSGGGILLYGLPGTGKTMIAKAIAHEVQAKFYSIKCSDIVSKWFGEAERNVKALFETARKDDKAIIFFDEFEALAARRGGDNNGVMNRLVPELLAQIQGFNDDDSKHILLLAATNRPWDIDSAMLRPGRFNEKIYIGLPDEKAREFMIKKTLKGAPLEDDVDINEIIKRTEGFNGSDVVEFCERLKDNPIRKSIETQGKTIFKITNEDIDYASSKVTSSVQQKDIEELTNFMNQFDNKN